jgi:gliding motility-associated protein GldM
MAGGRETPRQKMIGMMYLVLTAMLALNVSKEIINAFVTQDNQMLVNNNNLVEGINGFMTKFSNLELDVNSRKSFLKWKPKVIEVNNMANNLDDYLLTNLNKMMEESEKQKDWFVKTKETQYTTWSPIETINNKEDYDIATRLFGGEKASKGYKKGGEIREKLMELRDSLLFTMGNYSQRKNKYELMPEWLESNEVLEKELTKNQHPDKLKLLSIYNTLSQPEKLDNHDKQEAWQLVKFDHQPIVGAIGVFTEFRNQIRMAQQKALELVASKVEQPIMKINKIEPQLIAAKSYLNQGDTLGVRVGIIAYDSNATYPIKYTIGSQELSSDNNRFTIRAGAVGQQTVNGSLVLDLADGAREFPWSFDYTVGKPMGTISSPEYNVLFSDNYSNVIEASFSGYSSTDISVSCPDCKEFGKVNGKYIAKVRNGTTPTVTVRAKGSTMSRKYIVKSVPKPEFYFLNKTSGGLRKGDRDQANVCLVKSPKSSILDVRYEVVGFSMEAYTSNGIVSLGSSNSRNLTGAMKSSVKRLNRGERIAFTKIRYRIVGNSKIKPYGPDVMYKAI